MSWHRCLIFLIVLPAWLAGTSGPACAAGRVELELVTDEQVPITSQQDWLRRLARVGVANLRIRAGRGGDRAHVEVRGPQSAPVYVVTGVITSGGEILVPGGRFRPGEAARLAQWLEELGRLGPPEQRPQKSAFGLTPEAFGRVHDDLARPVGFSTKGMRRADVVGRIGRELLLPLRVSPGAIPRGEEGKLAEELSGLTRGTALAYLLRPVGLCLVPRESAGGGPEYVIVRPRGPDLEAWPVGWKAKKPKKDLVPGMFEFLNVNIKGVTVAKVLEEVGARLKVPILPDYNAMARHGIEPDKVFVSLPQTRTTYSLVLRKVLFQARLKSELRVDEAGKPLLWITTLKPI